MPKYTYVISKQGFNDVITVKEDSKQIDSRASSNAGIDGLKQESIVFLQDKYPGVKDMTDATPPKAGTTGTTATGTNPNTTTSTTKPIENLETFDPRLQYAINSATGEVVYSMSGTNEHPLIDGMIFTVDATKVQGKNLTDDQAGNFGRLFYGVPSLMNPNSYINIQAAGGKGQNKYLIDRENQIRFYNASEPHAGDGSGVQASSAPTVAEIIKWSSDPNNVNKFPYKFTDFAFCKWWKKIPNNYMITLRRYPFPVNDAVVWGEEGNNTLPKENLKPVATMITYLGEDPGNKMSTILGPIESNLKWKDLEADVWPVTTSGSAAEVNNPAPGFAKLLGFLQSGAEGAKTKQQMDPIDPYTNGPYINKIQGPVNVITKTKMRERGLEFKHTIPLIFEYSIRSIGGVNTKAAGLDIIGNCMLMTSATASFWGGANRHVPYAGAGVADPFLGGKAGKAAWVRGDPEGFFGALKEQFTGIASNISDIFNKIFANPIDGLQQLAQGGAKAFMQMSTTQARWTQSGIHSLLTGAPVGEWHVTIGPPMNPMMMMGNMICTNGKLEFNDELGPDDFPTEIKFTVTLEHGMPRDKAAIESMFNKGRGRLYSLPKGYEKSFASSSQSPVDKSIPAKYALMRNSPNPPDQGSNNANIAVEAEKSKALTNGPVVSNVFGALYSQGYGYTPGVAATQNADAKLAVKK